MSNTYSISNAIDNLFEKAFDTFTTSDSIIYPGDTSIKGIESTTRTNDGINYRYTPITKYDNWWDLVTEFDFPKITTPSYPVSSYYILEDGSSVIELAVSGFKKSELELKQEGKKLIISGTHNEKEDVKKKVVWDKLAKRNFSVIFSCSHRMNLDEMSAFLEDGVLTIKVPLKEEEKPIKKEIEIK